MLESSQVIKMVMQGMQQDAEKKVAFREGHTFSKFMQSLWKHHEITQNLLQAQNDAKLRAMRTRVDYDTFTKMVCSNAHAGMPAPLQPLPPPKYRFRQPTSSHCQRPPLCNPKVSQTHTYCTPP